MIGLHAGICDAQYLKKQNSRAGGRAPAAATRAPLAGERIEHLPCTAQGYPGTRGQAHLRHLRAKALLKACHECQARIAASLPPSVPFEGYRSGG